MWGEEGLVDARGVCVEGCERAGAVGSPLDGEYDVKVWLVDQRMREHTSFTLPSHDAETKVSFLILDQSTEFTSLVCSCQTLMGKS